MSARVRLHRIEAHPVTLHFSPGYGARAQQLGALVGQAHDFLAAWLGVEAQTTLSVLRRESWRHLRRAPYGYPHSSPDKGTIFAPAHYPPPLVDRLRGLYERAPYPLREAVGPPDLLDREIRTFYDLVAVHELGHLFAHHLALSLGTRWLTELVANLFATAFFLEVRPDLAHVWTAWAELQAALDVPYRSLQAYESRYVVLDFANANYYQGRLNQQARRLWEQQGRAIAPALLQQFSLHPDLVAARFQQVAPAFAWEA